MFRKMFSVALVVCLLGVTGCFTTGGGKPPASEGRKTFKRGAQGEATIVRAAKDTPKPTASKTEVPALVTSIRKYEEPMIVEEVKQGEINIDEPVKAQEPGKVYKLKPSDVVSITLRGIPQPDQVDDIVDENGYVTLPYIDRVLAVGKTSSELERLIRKRYLDGRIYKDVTVNVVVPTQNYFIRGEVKRPSRYPLVAGVTLIQALAAAGGYTEYANSGKIKVLRGGSSFTVNAKDIERHPEKDVTIEAGDIIVVPRSVF